VLLIATAHAVQLSACDLTDAAMSAVLSSGPTAVACIRAVSMLSLLV
jgi:hypothetical protein